MYIYIRIYNLNTNPAPTLLAKPAKISNFSNFGQQLTTGVPFFIQKKKKKKAMVYDI